MRNRSTGRRLAAGILAVGLTACAGASSHPTSPHPLGPAPDDVLAARACVAFQRYVIDIKNRQPNAADNTAFNKALTQLTAKAGSKGKWSALVTDMDNFLVDGEYENTQALDADGLATGQQCATVPADAQAAGGLS